MIFDIANSYLTDMSSHLPLVPEEYVKNFCLERLCQLTYVSDTVPARCSIQQIPNLGFPSIYTCYGDLSNSLPMLKAPKLEVSWADAADVKSAADGTQVHVL